LDIWPIIHPLGRFLRIKMSQKSAGKVGRHTPIPRCQMQQPPQ
jgi:hypothetical protein